MLDVCAVTAAWRRPRREQRSEQTGSAAMTQAIQYLCMTVMTLSCVLALHPSPFSFLPSLPSSSSSLFLASDMHLKCLGFLFAFGAYFVADVVASPLPVPELVEPNHFDNNSPWCSIVCLERSLDERHLLRRPPWSLNSARQERRRRERPGS